MKKSLTEILKELKSILPEIKEKYSVSTIELFGSYVLNHQTNKSDVDLLVSFHEVPGLIKFIELENFISDKLNVKVDLVIKDSIKPSLKNYIIPNTISL